LITDDAALVILQDNLHLSAEQECQIMASYEGMHKQLLKCAEERNNTILPQLETAGVNFAKARPSSFILCSQQWCMWCSQKKCVSKYIDPFYHIHTPLIPP
jgi:hypothetical protein